MIGSLIIALSFSFLVFGLLDKFSYKDEHNDIEERKKEIKEWNQK